MSYLCTCHLQEYRYIPEVHGCGVVASKMMRKRPNDLHSMLVLDTLPRLICACVQSQTFPRVGVTFTVVLQLGSLVSLDTVPSCFFLVICCYAYQTTDEPPYLIILLFLETFCVFWRSCKVLQVPLELFYILAYCTAGSSRYSRL